MKMTIALINEKDKELKEDSDSCSSIKEKNDIITSKIMWLIDELNKKIEECKMLEAEHDKIEGHSKCLESRLYSSESCSLCKSLWIKLL